VEEEEEEEKSRPGVARHSAYLLPTALTPHLTTSCHSKKFQMYMCCSHLPLLLFLVLVLLHLLVLILVLLFLFLLLQNPRRNNYN
jgi:hypothetical protein